MKGIILWVAPSKENSSCINSLNPSLSNFIWEIRANKRKID